VAIHAIRLEVPRQFPEPSGTWLLTHLTDITVIFGRNGTGKSQLLRYLRDQQRESRHYASPERGGEISFNASYMQEEYAAATRGSRRTGNTAPTYRDEGIARVQAFLARRGNVRTSPVPIPPQQLEALMNVLLPAFTFEIRGGVTPTRLTRVSNGQEISSVSVLSSGEAALFSLGLDLVSICGMWVLDEQKGGILLVDEPDLHLHPDLQQHLASFIVHLVDTFSVQVIVATHSTTLLAALGHYGGGRTSVVYLDPTGAEQQAKPFTQAAQELATCLGGHALMGPLFALPLLLVEGDDDYKVWAQAVRHHILKVAVIPCDGSRLREYEAALDRIFAAMVDKTDTPLGFGLHDLDDRTDQPVISGGFVRRLWLNCREVENLYMTTEVLGAMGKTVGEARAQIAARAAEFGGKAALLQEVVNADWQRCDLKGVMEQIAQIIDPQLVDWRIRLGQTIGKGEPSGNLRAFLGDEVVAALWRGPEGPPAAAAPAQA